MANQLYDKAHAGVTLTAANQFSTPAPLFDNSEMTILALYTPVSTGAGIKLNVIVQVSPDTLDTATASSTWIQVGTTSNSSGTLTFTPSVLKFVSNTTTLSGDWSFLTQGKKYRIGILEEGSPGSAGTASVWVFSKMES